VAGSCTFGRLLKWQTAAKITPTGLATPLKSPSVATSRFRLASSIPGVCAARWFERKEFLHRLVLLGLRERYGARSEKFQPQVMEELGIISDVGYEEYFLITWDFLQDCRQRGIEWITRGSAADSLVCYCLGISGVCPIRFDLYFKRFLNKERMALHKLPDIDIDFAHDFKDDVVKLIFEKYGRNHCAVVGGFSTFQARSAFAEVAKVLGWRSARCGSLRPLSVEFWRWLGAGRADAKRRRRVD